MNTFFDDAAVSAGLWMAIKASVVFGIAALVQWFVARRASAAMRHLVWMLAISIVLVLPLLSVVLPAWTVVIPTAGTDAGAPAEPRVGAATDLVETVASSTVPIDPAPAAPGPAALSPAALIVGVYLAGVLGVLIRLLAHGWSARRFARRAAVVDDEEWTRLLAECASRIGVRRPVRLLRSHQHSVPVAFGARRPSIAIPDIADTWAHDRRRAVVLHELAHVARHDCLTQIAAFAACAIYWFHPAAWWIARRLRVERELACDDRVIAAGTHAREYAGHLLEIAYAAGGRNAPALLVGMARPRQLEGRMLAALDHARNRTVPAFRLRAASAAIGAALAVPLAMATPATVVAEAGGADDARAAALSAVAPAQDERTHPAPPEAGLMESARRLVRRAAGVVLEIAQDALAGTWEIRPTTSAGMVRLRLTEVNSSSDSNIPLDRLEGLTAAQLGSDRGAIQFRLRRDAGTFTFDGVVRSGVGAGTFSFTADPNFAAELAKRGFARPTAREQYQMARHDIGYAFVDELKKQGYATPETSLLVRAGQHGVEVTYLRDMATLGYRLGSLEPLIELRDHGVSPGYVRELAGEGYKGLAAGDIRRARDHGITPEYVRGLRDAGYGSLPMDALINARDHGVSVEFVRELGDAGHRKVPLDELIRVRDHGVSPEYVRDMRQLGYPLPLTDLIGARDHGVSVEFVREIAALGYNGQPMAGLIRLRDHGVSPEYVKELKALGYDRLAVDDLVTLRDHGLTADRIRSANSRAGTRLPVDLLKSLARGGGD